MKKKDSSVVNSLVTERHRKLLHVAEEISHFFGKRSEIFEKTTEIFLKKSDLLAEKVRDKFGITYGFSLLAAKLPNKMTIFARRPISSLQFYFFHS